MKLVSVVPMVVKSLPSVSRAQTIQIIGILYAYLISLDLLDFLINLVFHLCRRGRSLALFC
jgi:hypothetical protein